MKIEKKSLIGWTCGLVPILLLLYFTVLRHPGYIFFWDLSGAFDFRDPFDQYLYMFTPWDGINIGTKNRIPIVMIIYLIFKPLQFLFGLSYEWVIKIVVTLLFVGAYSVFYFLLPRWIELFSRKKAKKFNGFVFWRIALSVIYLFIPFWTYRISQLHMFYMSVFYPIHTYLFIKLLTQEKFNKKLVILFILSMFLGLTSPHQILFELITFAVIFTFYILLSKKREKNFKALLTNLGFSFIGTVLTNLYWILPYILIEIPSPGYMINDSVVELLSQGTSLRNFLLGQSDWFVNQGNLGIISAEFPSVANIQIFGLVLFSLVSIYGLIKSKLKYSIPIIFLLLVSVFFIVPDIPFHNEIITFLMFSRFGWIFREVNKLHVFWAFWCFLFFSVGMIGVLSSVKKRDYIDKLIKWFVVPSLLIPYLIYIAPVGISFWKFIKPVEIDHTITEVFDYLENDNDLFYVYYYPTSEPYTIPWMEDRFEISDVVDYQFLTYNSPKPSVFNGSVIPASKSYTTLFSEYLFQNRKYVGDVSGYLSDLGVKYFVIRKNANPTKLSEETVNEEFIIPSIEYLDNDEHFDKVIENDNYVLYLNKTFEYGLDLSSKQYISADSFSIVEHIEGKQDILFCNFPENFSDCLIQDELSTLRYSDNEFFYLDFLSEEEKQKYTIYPYDFVTDHGIGVDWGRASFYDRVNGEIHNVFRNYGINAWNFDISGKVIYSDISLIDEDRQPSVTFTENVECKNQCNIYALVLKNHLGGSLQLEIDSSVYKIDTQSNFENYRWMMIDSEKVFDGSAVLTLKNGLGFNSIGGILILPNSTAETLKVDFSVNRNVIDIPTSGYVKIENDDSSCEVSSYEYLEGFVSKIDVSGNCDGPASISVPTYDQKVLVSQDGEVGFSKEEDLSTGEFDVEFSLVTPLDILMWVWLAIDIVLVTSVIFLGFVL